MAADPFRTSKLFECFAARCLAAPLTLYLVA
jgi:hypothetical protein